MLMLALGACGGAIFRGEAPPREDPSPGMPGSEAPVAGPPASGAGPLEPAVEVPEREVEYIPAPPSAEERMVHFAHTWLGLSKEAQRQEFLQSEALYLKEGTPYNLVRYALLTTLRGSERPGSTKRVRGELRSYIDEHNGTDERGEFVPLARLLLHVLEEREQLLGQLTAQNETLQRQLDELKAIEEQLRDRGGPEPIQAPQ